MAMEEVKPLPEEPEGGMQPFGEDQEWQFGIVSAILAEVDERPALIADALQTGGKEVAKTADPDPGQDLITQSARGVGGPHRDLPAKVLKVLGKVKDKGGGRIPRPAGKI